MKTYYAAKVRLLKLVTNGIIVSLVDIDLKRTAHNQQKHFTTIYNYYAELYHRQTLSAPENATFVRHVFVGVDATSCYLGFVNIY